MTDREIMQQALNAILAARESELLHPKPFQNRYLDIIGKLETALAQPEQLGKMSITALRLDEEQT